MRSFAFLLALIAMPLPGSAEPLFLAEYVAELREALVIGKDDRAREILQTIRETFANDPVLTPERMERLVQTEVLLALEADAPAPPMSSLPAAIAELARASGGEDLTSAAPHTRDEILWRAGWFLASGFPAKALAILTQLPRGDRSRVELGYEAAKQATLDVPRTAYARWLVALNGDPSLAALYDALANAGQEQMSKRLRAHLASRAGHHVDLTPALATRQTPISPVPVAAEVHLHSGASFSGEIIRSSEDGLHLRLPDNAGEIFFPGERVRELRAEEAVHLLENYPEAAQHLSQRDLHAIPLAQTHLVYPYLRPGPERDRRHAWLIKQKPENARTLLVSGCPLTAPFSFAAAMEHLAASDALDLRVQQGILAWLLVTPPAGNRTQVIEALDLAPSERVFLQAIDETDRANH